jgi:hypothetical protein
LGTGKSKDGAGALGHRPPARAGAFDDFTIPPVPGVAFRDPGDRVYAIRFVAFVFLALLSFAMLWILKYMPEEAEGRSPEPSKGAACRTGRGFVGCGPAAPCGQAHRPARLDLLGLSS